jgi:protein-S-isoprenylcysteine O-methyltransferase Ste14
MAGYDFQRLAIELPWLIFVVYWLIGALKTKPISIKESFASRYGILLIEITGFVLLFNSSAEIGFLRYHLLPRTLAMSLAGIVLTWAGIAIAIWARHHLGQYWSARVTIKEGHQLIRTGPYASMRHPIYSGVVLAAAGSALTIDRWRCAVGVGLILLGYCLKARKEEKMLSVQFGEAFVEHRKHTGFLIPRLR